MTAIRPSRSDWSIPDDVTYLNHGSFGPAPRVVQESREEWSHRLGRQPMDFFLKQMEPALDEAMTSLAKFVGADPRDMAFVDNATVAMNVVAGSIELNRGDEVLLTEHEYGAVFRIWRRRCEEVGARLITARIAELPTNEVHRSKSNSNVGMSFDETMTSDGAVQSIFRFVTERTKLIVVSHITSPTATIFPVEEVCRRARLQNIPVCVDGPHAIAMLDVDLRKIDCDYYCASLHKWLSAPFGSGFLYVKRAHQKGLRPHLTSWGRSLGGAPERWQDQFNWLGTRDPAPFLAVPVAIEFLQQTGLETFRMSTHQLAKSARQKLESFFKQVSPIPDSRDWYGSMTAVPLPPSDYKKARPNSMHPLQKELRERFRIEVPITECSGHSYLRVSCHLYNTPEEIDYLMESMIKIVNEKTGIL